MDSIDERNQKEKMAKSIIKRRNVVYGQFQVAVTPEQHRPVSEAGAAAEEEKE